MKEAVYWLLAVPLPVLLVAYIVVASSIEAGNWPVNWPNQMVSPGHP